MNQRLHATWVARSGLGILAFVVGCSGSSSKAGTSPMPDAGGDAASTSQESAGARGYCDLIQNSGECFEYDAGFLLSDAQTDCNIRHGTYSATGTCDTSSSVGGCHQVFGNGRVSTTWYYSPVMANAVEPTCEADGNATYVMAP